MSIARILVIAGSDSGGGAGIQADIKTVTLLGGYAMTAITAITAQNTLGVAAVHALPAEMVIAQIDAVAGDIGLDAIKIGMIGSADIVAAVAERLGRPDLADIPLVFDPVMIATSGSRLADGATIAAFGRLMRRAAVSTPNLDELGTLSSHDVTDENDVVKAARSLILAGSGPILATGAGFDEGRLTDMLFTAREADPPVCWSADRIDTVHDHGTGCTLASGIATGLAQGLSLSDAIARSRRFVRSALLAAPGLGKGHGPMGHRALSD